MKRPKKIIVTCEQIEHALVEQIEHARGMNVPVNSLSSATSFTLLVLSRVFGKDRKMSQELQDSYSQLREDARVERFNEEQKQKALDDKARREKQMIVVPGRDN